MKNAQISKALQQSNISPQHIHNIKPLDLPILQPPPTPSLPTKYSQHFTFTDTLANNILSLNNTTSSSPSTNSHQLLKQTRKFHLDSIKTRNYKPSRHTAPISYPNDDISINLFKQKFYQYHKRKKQQSDYFIQEKSLLNQLLNKKFKQQPNNLSTLQISINQNNQQSALSNKKQQQQLTKSQQKQTYFSKLFNQNPPLCQYINNNKQNYISKQQNSFDLNQLINFKLINHIKTKLSKQQKIKNNNHKRSSHSKKIYIQQQKSKKQLLSQLSTSIHYQLQKNIDYLIKPKSFTKVCLFHKSNKFYLTNDNYQFNKIKLSNHNSFITKKLNLINLSSTHTKPLKQSYSLHTDLKKQQKLISDVSQFKFNQQINQQLSYKYSTKNQLANQINLTTTNNQPTKNNQDHHQIIQFIKRGNYFRIQIQLSLKNDFLFIHEKITNNNLLHLSILHHQVDIFWMILSKLEQHKIKMLNQPNKYSKTPFQLAKVYKIINKKDSLYDVLQNPRLQKFQP